MRPATAEAATAAELNRRASHFKRFDAPRLTEDARAAVAALAFLARAQSFSPTTPPAVPRSRTCAARTSCTGSVR